MSYKQDREIEERKQIMLDVSEGMKTVYWKHLEAKLKAWVSAEQKYIASFRQVTQENMDKYNEASIRLELLNQILKINESILKDQKNYLERTVNWVKEIFTYKKTFVGNGN